jgi:hypothetical protein
MQQETRKSKILDLILNVLTGLILLVTIAIISLQITIFLNPTVIFNPFPPYKLPEALVIQYPTQGTMQEVFVPTSTPEPILQPTETIAPTITPTEIFIDGTPVAEETPLDPTETPFSGYFAFALQNDINAIESSLIRPNYGCDWVGVAGQVFDLQGRPVVGVRVWLRGTYDNNRINLYSLTMESSPYGPSGFEFRLGDKPLNTNGQLSIQLLDQAGIPISERIYFDTFEDCQKNLILINFKQIR